jgi:hypothetical protein
MAGVTGFLHAHHVASIVAATAMVGGGAAGAAWHSSQPVSTPSPAHGNAAQRSPGTAAQVSRWMAHHRAYFAQLGWLRRHDLRDHRWMAHYRSYSRQLDWMLRHRAYGHMPDGDRVSHARMHWLRDHRSWNSAQMHRSTWYRHNHRWMHDHMGGDGGMGR